MSSKRTTSSDDKDTSKKAKLGDDELNVNDEKKYSDRKNKDIVDRRGRRFEIFDLDLIEIIKAMKNKTIDIVQRPISYIHHNHSFVDFPDDDDVNDLGQHLSKSEGYYLRIEEGVINRRGEQLHFHNDSRYIYIFPAYERLYAVLKASDVKRDQYLTGTSGTGKSYFIYYLIFRCIQEQCHFYVNGFLSHVHPYMIYSSSYTYATIYSQDYFEFKSTSIPFNIGNSCRPLHFSLLSPPPSQVRNFVVTSDYSQLTYRRDNVDFYMFPPHSGLTMAAVGQCPQFMSNEYKMASPFLCFAAYSFIASKFNELFDFGEQYYQVSTMDPKAESKVEPTDYLYRNEECDSEYFLNTHFTSALDMHGKVENSEVLIGNRIFEHTNLKNPTSFPIKQHLFDHDYPSKQFNPVLASSNPTSEPIKVDASFVDRPINDRTMKKVIEQGIIQSQLQRNPNLKKLYIDILEKFLNDLKSKCKHSSGQKLAGLFVFHITNAYLRFSCDNDTESLDFDMIMSIKDKDESNTRILSFFRSSLIRTLVYGMISDPETCV